jgi:hypothetical protein
MVPLKEAHSFMEKLIIYYIVFGLLAITPLATYFGITYSFIVPSILCALYFAGFVYLVVRVQQRNGVMLKRILFNLAVVLRNENDRGLVQHGIKARPGYLGKWIEFH